MPIVSAAAITRRAASANSARPSLQASVDREAAEDDDGDGLRHVAPDAARCWNGADLETWVPATPSVTPGGTVGTVQPPFGQALFDRAAELVPFPLTEDEKRSILKETQTEAPMDVDRQR